MVMSLSSGFRGPISTCLTFAKKSYTIPMAKCCVLILNCADDLGGGGCMQTRSDVKYYILASSHSEYFQSLFACILQIPPNLRRELSWLSVPPKCD